MARNIGLACEPVRCQTLRQTVTVSAEVAYDAWKLARLAPRAPGVVTRIQKDLGEPVRAGEVLAVIDSTDLGAAKAALLQALASVRLWERNHEREQRLLVQGIATEREALDAETSLAESRIELGRAQQRLRNLGLGDVEIDQVAARESASSLLELTAPLDGVVVERAASVGEVVDPSRPLLTVADTANMWALLDLVPSHLGQVGVGQAVVLTIDGLRGETFAGHLTWISTSVDPRTRTIKARAEIDNARGLLRAGSFGHAQITTRDRAPAVLVSDAAVQWEGCCNVVFVRQSDTVYRPRKVRLGHVAGDFHEVLEGLAENELVVTDGSFLLKAELLKGSIGAGCCEVEHLAR